MSEREVRFRTAIVTYFPMFIAALSLVTAIYNGYLNSRFVDLIQRNLGRAEYLRTCKEILEGHAQVQFRAKILSQTGERARSGGSADMTAARNEADNALIKYISLATYLANLQPQARERYTLLSIELEKTLNDAPRLTSSDLKARFDKSDQMFTDMNEDCVRMAKL
jgi:flagellar basal body-associated protein FliL